MKIQPVEYKREDGVSMIMLRNNQWVLRKLEGPAYFYDSTEKEWVLGHTHSSEEIFALSLPFAEALALLETVEK